jgi:hypothetical protein
MLWFFGSVCVVKLKLIHDQGSVGQSVLVLDSHLEPMTRFLFSVWNLEGQVPIFISPGNRVAEL